MRGVTPSTDFICARCVRAGLRARQSPVERFRHHFSTTSPQRRDDGQDGSKKVDEEQGAMSKRLAEMSEENLITGGRSAKKAVEEAGFSEDLRRRLEERIKDTSFKSQNAQAFAQANLPSSAGRGTQDIAGARPWSGTETVEDASLRMLNDAFKPIKVPVRAGGPAVRTPTKIDTGRTKGKSSTGGRLASARDKSSIYSYLKDPNLSEKEKEEMRKQLKERFQPGARAVPATIQGLASLANERIEDAIARGQFKNLRRGQKIERDYTASSPFLDTTEYFMNKIIQKQEIVPPWIEKQQELVSDATKFRARLRNDWRRHVARTIASQGGGLEKQVRLAEAYAVAETRENPTKTKVEQINTVDSSGHMSQITLAGELTSAETTSAGVKNADTDTITVTEQPLDASQRTQSQPATQITLTTSPTSPSPIPAPATPPANPLPSVSPFRDMTWLATEKGYHTAAITSLNNLTRSYNLMAPTLAKKPYFNLDRELKSCYADVAPLIAVEIQQRARAPTLKVEMSRGQSGGVLERLGGGSARVREDVRPRYGFKEFWKDLFGKEKGGLWG